MSQQAIGHYQTGSIRTVSAKTGHPRFCNYTARNLKNYNLETNVAVTGQASYPAIASAQQYFDQAWNNQNGQVMSVDYDEYKDESWLKYWLYRFMEWSGLSTF